MTEAPLYADMKFHTGPKAYRFRTYIATLEPGDECIVDTKNGITMATFIGYNEPMDIAKKFVIAVCDKQSLASMRAGRAAED